MKSVIITRAVPGSGKTTITNCIVNSLHKTGLSTKVCSTDEYFMQNGRYCFDITKLGENHAKNLIAFEEGLKLNTQLVVCDNTNILPWQTEDYSNVARKYGYSVILLNMTPRAIEEHVKTQIVTEQKPDAHGVEKEVIERFVADFWNYNSLTIKNSKIDPIKHKNYYWDSKSQRRIESSTQCKHFDYDKLIVIEPHEYRPVQKTIGLDVLNYVEI